MNKRYKCIDSVKGIACLAVILIHYNFPGELGIIVKTLCRFAVPFFLCVSGFFLMHSSDRVCYRKYSFKKLKHVIGLLLCSAVFYAFFDIILNLYLERSWDIGIYSAKILTSKKLARLFITNDPFIYSHLWYLLALIYCYLTTMLFKDGRCPKIGLWLCPIGFLFFLMYGPYKEALGIWSTWDIIVGDEVLSIYRFNLFFARALPFFLLGIIFRKNQELIKEINIDRAVIKILILLGMTVSLFERCLLRESQWYIGTIVAVVCIFVWGIKYPDSGNETLIYIGRNLSVYVYIIHVAVGKTIGVIAVKNGIADNDMYIYIKPFLVIAVSLTCAYMVYAVKAQMAGGKNNTAMLKKSA